MTSISSFMNDLINTIVSNEQPMIGGITFIGTIVTILFCYKILRSTYQTFVRPSLSNRDLIQNIGKWVVITGATDGIGLAYAHLFAKKGCSIVLISRTESKLQSVQQELLTKYNSTTTPIEVQYIVCDYSKPIDQTMIQSKLETIAASSTIGILINNVGVSYRYPMYVHELSNDEITTMIQMNIMSVVIMTRLLLPIMMKQKHGGTIINLSSGSALYSLPLLAVYSGTKSFVEKFSRAIHAEYNNKQYKISCQCQVPFYVATKLAKLRPSLTVPTPQQYVHMAYKWIQQSSSSNDVIVSPFYIHAILCIIYPNLY